MLVLDAAMHALRQFGAITAPPAPEHHGYLGTVTNATIPLLGTCMVLAGGNVQYGELNDDQWLAVMTMVHRAFYSSVLTATEGFCEGYCKVQGKSVLASKANRAPEFADYLNSALSCSSASDIRKSYWRKYFDGLRVLRNKVSHFDSHLTSHEEGMLREAGLDHHIGVDHMVQSNPSNYQPIAGNVLLFIQELEAHK